VLGQIFGVAQKGKIVLFNAAIRTSAVVGFSAFAMIEVDWQAFTGIKVQATFMSFASINKKLVFVHDLYQVNNGYGVETQV
jgi:hypothetical protein